ncbi:MULTISPECIES: Rrf2 family transcriptional regulator [unclassified Enterococcus]|uniref:RrF2 family transcriptional regulator n=1 Tax=unclassified Enterococcus TaxID=2608891 RepID=UPI001558269F|nr:MULTISPECIES: Rrf2 family transcriptional regulator [unclassified Enterococcus]MBS7578237.1 Rrf2 family transcriptional regulator [Enterococcus sp. MMGLQ5-2]MBS7585524.1 Rrf2 family transcriptional regulator [Enterococcus sp. MMGLQ5-1]NPD13383.1 Rrf2 family transcriptional regulator [Enterococcus sp. MMGLQ5-1]NPD38068.1 Rrf2 family transcriptional regulator [Enterococcus sp. MMGLQ5-2]
MKFSQSYIQAISFILVIATLPDGATLKSREISQLMGFSTSYTLKIGRKLVEAKLLKSDASKSGGYRLAKPIQAITLYDVYEAMNPLEKINTLDLDFIHRLFGLSSEVYQKEKRVEEILSETQMAVQATLSKMSLSELISKDSAGNLVSVNWSDKKND